MESNKFIAGALSGIIEVVLTHPIDFLKIKSQEFSQKKTSKKNFYDFIKKQKLKNYYSGIIPRISGIVPMRLTFWGVQDNTKIFLEKKHLNYNFNFLIIATVGASAQTIIDNQIEILKISQITNLSRKETIKSLLKFRGFNSCLLRNIMFTSSLSYCCFNKIKEEDTMYEKFKYSALGGAIGSLLSQPIDYVKTQQQRCNDNRNIRQILKEVYYSNPYKLYAGGLYRSILSIFTMGIGFTTYDFLKNVI